MEKSLGTCPSHQLSAFRPPPPPPPDPEPFAISANELNNEYLDCSYLSPQLIEALKEKMKAKESLQYLPASGFLQKKRFLVFDQCGNRTTLLSPAYLTWCWHDLNYKSGRTAENNKNNNSITCLSSSSDHRDESENNNNTHEDTEEIDALLYSDDDDDEEASTGRSPSFTRRDSEEEEEEEVTSSARSTKRIKLSE